MRAKIKALELVQGNHKGQYANIYDYLLELRRSNPGTTTICKLDCRLFQRLYICLEACKSGWLTGCRRIIGLDGCWLTGYYGGHLLAAVGVYANNCVYPVAFAAVESENKQSWFWFLELLQRDLEIDNSYNICFMSDKQKGLIEAISLLFPNAEARNCARHLYNNFKNIEGFRGQVMRLAYWKAAKATFPRQFEEAMSEMSIWPVYAGNEKYEVDCGLGNKHVVDLLNSSCLCRKWDLSGIPYKHVVSCMQLLAMNPETYVNTCYTVTTQLNIYSHLINPVKGPMQWEHVRDMEPILPSIIRRPLGRPKQTRRKEVGEERKSGPKLSKIG
ncbi:uncharacterized protein [Gossypium hirsutum]|uniref:Zinc finger PMZ-type domain-containing protein n=1 Tax=Gossypium hirsutum TaxID=3635 RepID=A0A1U8IKF7_GOSHI|nr:uncharacterized protein LOC107895597 [Gossypium hirsutum]